MVMVDDDRAVRYVLAQLRANDGNVTATAKAIGCGVRSLYVWRDSSVRLREGFENLALGRPGAGVHATEARLSKREAEKIPEPAQDPPKKSKRRA